MSGRTFSAGRSKCSSHVTIVEVAGTVAIVRVEADNWTGHRFTDYFTMLKTDGQWKIMNKTFHLHDE